MKHFKSTLIAAGLFAVALSASSASAASVFPTTLLDNNTGFADSLFLGAPDGDRTNLETAWVGIGSRTLTFDFGPYEIVNGSGSDFNVYEVNWGVVEFGKISVLASIDGLNFFDITSSQAAWVDIDGDEAHGQPSYAASYDLGSLSAARYIRITGTEAGGAGVYNGFDLDGIGAIHTRLATTAHGGISPVPLPAGMPLLLAGIAAFAGLRRRRTRS